ncbi:15688_t:CDS:2 [Funneliformis geosporum]|uniref:15688_t:CDS:1 n=1 Tax=Funneliformis geosporum TaxID=1117311 RepID=A0A9W4WWX0_9GLOM|nr:15688_t:CDS:2 [Funneliformis geosporum]
MRADQLTLLDIRDNNFSEKDLSMFSHLINLQTLYIGNTNQEKVNQDISNTDINSGVESLPDSLRLIEHSVKERPESRVKEISLQLVLFTNKEKEIGLTVNEYSLAEYLKKERKLDPQKIKDKEKGITYEKAKEDIKADFLREITYHKLFKDDYDGIGLKEIHKKGLIHRDLHIGNILNHGIGLTYITDLGLCQPVNEADKDKIYGVLPYVAPEVLRRKPYTRAADIYSFGIVAYEILSGFPPYYEYAHDEFLATKICQGLRPNFTIKIPQLLEDLIKRC